MKLKKSAYLFLIISLGCFPGRCFASAALSLYGTFHSMGVIVNIDATDDPDQNAMAQVEYRTGEEPFHR